MERPEILYEDNHLIVVNKPGGVLIQGDKTRDVTLPDMVREYLRVTYDKPGNIYLGVVHRLDRPVSGVALFGKTSKATKRMNEAFHKNEVEKRYLAIVENEPPLEEDVLVGYMVKDSLKNKSKLIDNRVPKGKYAELRYRWIGNSDRYYLLEVFPVTGRHHQIRVMLSHIGCPIKGDLKYGAKRSNPDGNICLHARSLKFTHPVRKELQVVTAPFPDDPIWKAFDGLA